VHDFLVKLGGAERVVKVLSEMYPDADIFTLFYDESKVGAMFPKERVKTSWMQGLPKIIRNKYKFLTHKFPSAIESLNLENYDLVISSNTALSHGVLTGLNTKHICYCHSPMRYGWDWSNEYVKENEIKGFKKLLYAPLMKYLREWDTLAADRPDVYLANSVNVQGRIKKYFRQPSEVVYPPVDTNRFKAKEDNQGYFLIVSTLTPYKKIGLAVQLFNKIGRKLIIIGDGPERKFLESIAGDNIEFLGYKDDDVVKEYMENCRAFIFPGEEDFGIAPVEAMACGKPVLGYFKGGLCETVIAGETGEFFYEPTVESMEDGLARLMYNEKFYKAHSIRRHATQFSREEFEKKMKRTVKHVMMHAQ